MLRRNYLVGFFVFCTVLVSSQVGIAQLANAVTDVPSKIRADFELADFYKKCVDYNGFPVVSSERVPDQALLEAAYLIEKMLGNRPDIVEALINARVRYSVMSVDEFTTDIPEHSHLEPKIYWDKRARGLGATPHAPCVSCGEENLLLYKGDKYFLENILVHEFAHAIHEVGMKTVDPKFDARLEATYQTAMKAGKWKGTYAATNRQEYFAEAVQSWFQCNRPKDSQHNGINSRKELREYDPGAAEMVEYVFRDNDWTYQRSDTREVDLEHLKGFDRSNAPEFKWPDHLKDFDAYQWERDQKKSKSEQGDEK